MSDSKYQDVFDLIDKAGGAKLPELKALSSSDRGKIIFNIWAAIFCPFFYFYHKMWKKAITYYVFSIVLSIILGFIVAALNVNISDLLIGWIASMAIYATRANVDLYKKYKLNENGWI